MGTQQHCDIIKTNDAVNIIAARQGRYSNKIVPRIIRVTIYVI